MNNVRQKALRIRSRLTDLTAQFPQGDCVLMSLANSTFQTIGGLVVETPIEIAAQHLVEGTHRLATAAEIATFRAAQQEERRALTAMEPAKGAVYFAQPYKP